MTAYLDCNATTPLEPDVFAAMKTFFGEEYGNSGSRTHEFGAIAKKAVEEARDRVGAVVGAERDEVIFTSGATESDNLAILGLRAFGEANSRRHIITTRIEHKAVLEPIAFLEKEGFEVTYLDVSASGWIEPESILNALKPDTLLVSVMHVNNETGVVQPIEEISTVLEDHEAFFHVDAAQGFGKKIEALRSKRVDLISISGHKIYGPKGVGALIARKRGYRRAPLVPLMFGGGQERTLRPGTLPVPLVAGLGVAADLALKDHVKRDKVCAEMRMKAVDALSCLRPEFHGDQDRCSSHVLNLSVPGVDAEAAMVALKGIAAISNGSACTSSSYTPSHVLESMGLSEEQISTSLRISWCHLTGKVDWEGIAAALQKLR